MNIKNTILYPVNILLTALLLVWVSGCSTMSEPAVAEVPARHAIEDYVKDDVNYVSDVYDPWEPMNRRIYNFNTRFDRYIFLPVVAGYEYILPDFAEDRISDFFANIRDIKNFINSVLQLKPDAAYTALARFTINTTVGIAGLWDPATKIGVDEWREDFGQTLGRYGVGDGPFLVLPIFGPSNVRDGIGLGVDTYMRVELRDELDMKDGEELALDVLSGIDTRHRTAFRYYETGSPFEYELVRLLYGKARQLEISK